MPNIAIDTGRIIAGNDFDFNNPKDYLEAVLNSNNWNAEELETGNSGYVKYRLTHPNDAREFSIYVYLKPVKWRSGRNENEKQHQMQANVDMRGYSAVQSETSKTVALGIYRDPQSASFLICAWNAFEWGPNKGVTPFNYNLKVQLLAEAFKIGFAKSVAEGRSIYAFQPDFIHYYLLNNNRLHERNDQFQSSEIMIKNTIYYGAPGTGKSHKVKNIVADTPQDRKEIITFHPEYDNAAFVGGYKPFSMLNEDTGLREIRYEFVPQAFTSIYIKAWKDAEKNNHYLVIEEINRGNCAEIFGDIFQLLDRNYSISPSKELKEHLEAKLGADHEGIAGGKMRLPDNLTILATMNTSDQSLFPMDSAFKRRWNWEYVPIDYQEKDEDGNPNESFEYVVKINETTSFKWIEFIEKVNSHIRQNPNLGMDKCIGNYFVKSSEKEISIEEFIQKVIFYLWNDVFRDEENDVFERDMFYEDFFPIKTKGIENVRKILNNIGIEITETEQNPPV